MEPMTIAAIGAGVLGGAGSMGGMLDSIFGGGDDPSADVARKYRDMYRTFAPKSVSTIYDQSHKLLEGIEEPYGKHAQYQGLLSPALQYALDSMKRMTDISAVGGLDELTKTGIAGLDQLSATLSERGEITGGQRYQMDQGLQDRVLQAMLQTRRAAAQTYAGYEADTYTNAYNEAMGNLKWIGGGMSGNLATGYQPTQSNLGSQIGGMVSGLAGTISGMMGGGSPFSGGAGAGSSGFSLNNPGGGNYNIPDIIPPNDPFWQLK